MLILLLLLVVPILAYDGNYALQFDGVDDFIAVQHSYLDDSLSEYWTLEAWIYPQQTQRDWQLNILGYPGRHPNLEYCGNNNAQCQPGQPLTQLRESNGQYYTIVADTVLAPNVWHHIAGTWNNVTLSLYLDGILAASINPYASGYVEARPCQYSDCDVGVQIGGFYFRNPDGLRYSRQYFAGLIDEVRLWKVGRSANEIVKNMKTTLTGAEPGLQYYWKFDEAHGSTVRSLASNAYGLLGGGNKSAEPIFVKSDAPINVDVQFAPRVVTVTKRETTGAVTAGALLAVFFLFGGLSIGSLLGYKARERKEHGLLLPWESAPPPSRDLFLGGNQAAESPLVQQEDIAHEIAADDTVVQ